jgi:hypothetical protein
VIGRGDNRIDPPGLAPGLLQAFVRLRARYLMDEMAIDIEQRRPIAFRADNVAASKFVVECARNRDRVRREAIIIA